MRIDTSDCKAAPISCAAVRLRTQLLVLLAAFACATALAALFGAKDFGTALTFGQIGFALALVYVLLRG